MKYCEPDLQSRQQLQAISYEINELRNKLLEVALLDVPCINNKNFYSAMEHLLEASSDVGLLRSVASPLFLSQLEQNRKEVCV